MKKVFVILGLLSFSISCEQSGQKYEVEIGANLKTDEEITCNCDELEKNDQNLFEFNGDLFTGLCEQSYPNSDEKYMTKQFLEGKVHGSIFYYSQSGEVILEEEYVGGDKVGEKGEILQVNCKALTKKEVDGQNLFFYNDKLFTGSCKDFYPNSEQTYVETYYKDGMLDGFSTYFNKDGSVLIMQKFEKNILVKEYATSMIEE